MAVPPVDPDYFDQVNYVIDAWSEPCEAPWYIYVETMGPAALEAFIVLLSFGWADVARGAFRPKGLGRRTGKRRGRWAKRIPRFPEIGNTLGKLLPISEQIEDYVKYGCAGRSFWRIDNAVQGVLFGWLVADVTLDFAFNWTSALYETVWCSASHKGRFSFHNTTMSPIPNDVWKVAGFQTEDYEDSPPNWNANSGFSGPTGCTVGAGLKIEQRIGFPKPTEFRVVVWNVDENKPFRDFAPCQLGDGGDGSACASANIPPNTNFEIRAWMSGASFADYGLGAVTATAS